MEKIINLLKTDISQYKSELNNFVFDLISSLSSLINNLNLEKLDNASKFEITIKDNVKNNLYIDIIPLENKEFGLFLYASGSHFSLGYAESEIMECYSGIEKDYSSIIAEIKARMYRYLSGYKVIEYLNRKNKRIKREYFFSNDKSEEKDEKIGTSKYFSFNRKIIDIKEYKNRLFK